MTHIEFMTELYKIVLDAARKQGFSIILLLGMSGGLWNMMHEQKNDFVVQYNEVSSRVDVLTSALGECNEARMQQGIEIASLKAQVNLLVAKKR